jgi:hypothetical protein
MTGDQWLLGWICTLITMLIGWRLYLAATYGDDKEDA